MQIDDLSNSEVVTIAVALLGGDTELVDREDVAVKVDEIAPGRFGWRKYPERVDLDAVGTALRRAKKPRSGGLLVGSNTQGWMLSSNGLKWFMSLDIDMLPGTEASRHRKHSILANQEAERARLRKTRAYQLYMDDRFAEITLQDFHDFARINEYFQTRARQRRFAIIDNAVGSDDILFDLWHLLKERFSKEMV